MQRTGYDVGDYAWYELDWRRDKSDRRVVHVELVRVEIMAIKPKRVSIKLLDFPQEWRMRSVSPSKIWWLA